MSWDLSAVFTDELFREKKMQIDANRHPRANIRITAE